MQDPSLSILRRKVGAGRAEPEFGMVSPAKALRLGVSKAAQDVLRTPMAVDGVDEERATLQSMAAMFPDRALNVLLHGPGDARGVLSLDQACLASVLQALTLGRFSDGPVQDRPPTSTDAMLTRRFVAVLLQAFGAALAGRPDAAWATGFGPRDRIDDLRRLPHLLADVSFRLFSITIDIGSGLRNGRICLALPADGNGVADTPQQDVDARADWSGRIERKVLDSPANLDVILGRVVLTLSDVAALRPDDVLTLPARCVGELSLETDAGEPVGFARLGQLDGSRAVCLTGLALQEPVTQMDSVGPEVRDKAMPPDGPAPEGRLSAVAVGPMTSVPASAVPQLTGVETPADREVPHA
ncbi:FliM/FliN family flagellar motor switch protein [Pseudoruegeria sp. SK021]|uniref:FliM/FliN family flagellar motor switch protein n=1 Tax=Pseudoruegeria sp. SK021 TaxID=1933035 RepID=UPI00143D92EA|nr:flagellar motor switch protein FliM [Pseudoruegeria sp. SK021]